MQKMTRDELLEHHTNLCQKAFELMDKKNQDYSGDRGVFANFQVSEMIGICSAEQGFMVRMSDKISRIISFIQKGELQVKDESVEDTILDIINYSILLSAYLREQKGRL